MKPRSIHSVGVSGYVFKQGDVVRSSFGTMLLLLGRKQLREGVLGWNCVVLLAVDEHAIGIMTSWSDYGLETMCEKIFDES